MNKIFWASKTKQFEIFRDLYPFNKILEKENANLKSLLNKIPIKNKLVLDMGTGTGNVLQMLDKSNQENISGIDFTYSMLKANKKSFPAVHLIQADVSCLPVKTNSVEVITAVGLAEYFNNIIPIFEESGRILKDEGWLIITFSPKNIWNWLRVILGHAIYTKNIDQIKSVAKFCRFQICESRESLMQQQLLFKKSSATDLQ